MSQASSILRSFLAFNDYLSTLAILLQDTHTSNNMADKRAFNRGFTERNGVLAIITRDWCRDRDLGCYVLRDNDPLAHRFIKCAHCNRRSKACEINDISV